MKTVAGLYQSFEEADRVTRALEAAGFEKGAISVIARDQALAEHLGPEPRVRDVTAGASTGALAGGIGGGLLGLLAGLGSLLIPGVGPVIAAGSIASALGLTAGGAGVGAAVGGILGAVTSLSVTEEEAEVYAEGVKRGNILIAVQAPEARAEEASRIILENGAQDYRELRETWRSQGWPGNSDPRAD
jgi:hypothetical protein